MNKKGKRVGIKSPKNTTKSPGNIQIYNKTRIHSHNLFVSLICQTFASKTAPGQKKLGKVICPDPWKSGATNVTEGGGRKLNENKLLTQKKNRFSPYSEFKKCRICKDTVHQKHSHYCQGADKCSRICAMCGKKVLDTSKYRQSSA
ncbi:hypothetical protein QZH41_011406 [Actinostola sp. cb2023]|nr:hypothetical protein QZH41_011406 [Actinostola sp. cb2023]